MCVVCTHSMAPAWLRDCTGMLFSYSQACVCFERMFVIHFQSDYTPDKHANAITRCARDPAPHTNTVVVAPASADIIPQRPRFSTSPQSANRRRRRRRLCTATATVLLLSCFADSYFRFSETFNIDFIVRMLHIYHILCIPSAS